MSCRFLCIDCLAVQANDAWASIHTKVTKENVQTIVLPFMWEIDLVGQSNAMHRHLMECTHLKSVIAV